MKKILVFVNPSSRQGAGQDLEVRRWLKERGFEVLNPDSNPQNGDVQSLIRQNKSDCDAVVIGGGDGSVNHALPALIDTHTPLLLIPLGTANNLARTLELPTKATEALELLEHGRVKTIDVGLANGIPFVNVIGLGLSTQVNRLTRSGQKRWFGVAAFIWTALKLALRMTPFRATVISDGHQHSARTWQITICNGRNYGCGLTIHEEANLTDGKLHGLSMEIARWWHVFRLIPNLLFGRFEEREDVAQFEGEAIYLYTRRPMRVDVDGDVKTKTPLEIRVRPRALRILVPAAAKV